MNTHSIARVGLLLAGALLTLSSSLSAQREAGLLGKQYAGLTVFTEDVQHLNIGQGYGTGLTVNIPVAPNLDFSFGASYEQFSYIHLTDKRLSATLVAYKQLPGLKIFADGSLSGTWQAVKYVGINISNRAGLCSFGTGAEVPVAPATALFGRVAYNRYIYDYTGDYWTFSFGLNHWISEKLGLVIAVTAYEDDSIVYGAGVNLRF